MITTFTFLRGHDNVSVDRSFDIKKNIAGMGHTYKLDEKEYLEGCENKQKNESVGEKKIPYDKNTRKTDRTT